MPKHTIELSKEEIRIINVIKAVKDIKSIDKAISFILSDYAENKDYMKFIREKGGFKQYYNKYVTYVTKKLQYGNCIEFD